jgi:hypothetical protein
MVFFFEQTSHSVECFRIFLTNPFFIIFVNMRKHLLLLIISLFTITCLKAQIQLPAGTNISQYNTAGEGDLYKDADSIYYIGMSNGRLKELGILTAKGVNDKEILQWDSTAQKWQNSAPIVGALTIEKKIIHTSSRARIRMNPIANLNTNVLTNIGFSAFDLNETNASIAGNGITGLEGKIRIIVQANINSNSERSNHNLQLLRNGSSVQEVFGGLYIRALSGHNSTGGQFIFELDDVQATDNLQFRFLREANSANTVQLVSTAATPSIIFIEQFEDIEVLTNATAPINFAIAQGPQGPQGIQGPQGPQGATISDPTDVYHATGSVNAFGTPNYIQGASVAWIGTGRYQVSFNTPHANGANYPILFSMEQNTGEDDYVPTYNNVTANGFDVEIGEQDNGGTAGVPQDAGFSFYVPL